MECQTIDVYMYSRYSQRVEGIDLYGDPPCIRMRAVEGECRLRCSRCPHSGGDEGLALGAWLLAS